MNENVQKDIERRVEECLLKESKLYAKETNLSGAIVSLCDIEKGYCKYQRPFQQYCLCIYDWELRRLKEEANKYGRS